MIEGTAEDVKRNVLERVRRMDIVVNLNDDDDIPPGAVDIIDDLLFRLHQTQEDRDRMAKRLSMKHGAEVTEEEMRRSKHRNQSVRTSSSSLMSTPIEATHSSASESLDDPCRLPFIPHTTLDSHGPPLPCQYETSVVVIPPGLLCDEPTVA